MKAALPGPPRAAGLELADWNWKVGREFLRPRSDVVLSRASGWNYLHRLGFGLKRPKKRRLKADAVRRDGFVRAYALLRAAAETSGTKIFVIDAAHFSADADLRGQWVLQGEPALVDSTSPAGARRPASTRPSASKPARSR